MLTRSLGRELIVPIDRLSNRVYRGDTLLVCSDGLYNVLEEEEMAGSSPMGTRPPPAGLSSTPPTNAGRSTT